LRRRWSLSSGCLTFSFMWPKGSLPCS